MKNLSPLQFTAGLFAFVILFFSLIWFRLPAEDAQAYFDFADQRCILGIDNFSDVLSNLAFALVGFYGLYLIQKNSFLHEEQRFIGRVLSAAMILVSIGSAYFHYYPTVERLFWDRVPMVLAFISVIALLITDRADKKLGLQVLFVLFVVCSLTLLLWRLNYLNLRPYLLIQFGGLLYIVLISCLRPKGQIANAHVASAFAFYALAKVFETFDKNIYEMTGIMSGHTLKHLAAALSMFVLIQAFSKIKNRPL